jgi:hypothetical protein
VLLDAVRQWETARRSGAFPKAMKAELQDIRREFHLAADGDGHSWRLYPVHITRERSGRPEAPAFRSIRFDNPYGAQPLSWILHSTGKSDVTGLTIQIDGREALLSPVSLAPGSILRYDGGEEAVLCDANWHPSGSVPVNTAAGRVPAGLATVHVSHRSTGGDPGWAIERRTLGPPRRLTARRRALQAAIKGSGSRGR